MSTLFRNKQNKKLYTIERCGYRYTGSWYEAKPWRHKNKILKIATEEDIEKKFEKVAYL